MSKKGSNKNAARPEKYQPYIQLMLEGKTLLPDELHDRQSLARIADAVRSICFVPVETLRLTGEDGKQVIGYRITQRDAHEYHTDRAAQERRQRAIIEDAVNMRDARRCKSLFARLGLELPPEVAALVRRANEKDETDIICEITDSGEIRRAS